MGIALILFILLVLILVLAYFLFLAGFTVFDIFLPAPFVATKKEQVLKMVEIADIKKGDRVIDLGSGDGRLVIAAAKLGAKSTGVEKNPFLVLISKIRLKLAKVKAKIILGDIFNQDLQTADVIFLYLNPATLKKLLPKLKKQTKSGTRIISNRYQIPGWKTSKNFDKIFLYRI